MEAFESNRRTFVGGRWERIIRDTGKAGGSLTRSALITRAPPGPRYLQQLTFYGLKLPAKAVAILKLFRGGIR